jgi:hypothetical protein
MHVCMHAWLTVACVHCCISTSRSTLPQLEHHCTDVQSAIERAGSLHFSPRGVTPEMHTNKQIFKAHNHLLIKCIPEGQCMLWEEVSSLLLLHHPKHLTTPLPSSPPVTRPPPLHLPLPRLTSPHLRPLQNSTSNICWLEIQPRRPFDMFQQRSKQHNAINKVRSFSIQMSVDATGSPFCLLLWPFYLNGVCTQICIGHNTVDSTIPSTAGGTYREQLG